MTVFKLGSKARGRWPTASVTGGKLRALTVGGDVGACWRFHREHEGIRHASCRDGLIPAA